MYEEQINHLPPSRSLHPPQFPFTIQYKPLLGADIRRTAKKLRNSLGNDIVDGVRRVQAVEPKVLVDGVRAVLVEGIPLRSSAVHAISITLFSIPSSSLSREKEKKNTHFW